MRCTAYDGRGLDQTAPSRGTHAPAVVVQVVVHQVGVIGVYTRVLAVLILCAVALVALVEDVVVIDQRIGRIREELEQQLFDLRMIDAFHLRRIVDVRALGLEMRQRHAEPVHAFGGNLIADYRCRPAEPSRQTTAKKSIVISAFIGSASPPI
jgi:hypothetical protein